MNVEKVRSDFAILQKGIVYLDSACMSLKPRQVTDAMMEYYNEFPACVGRSNHRLGESAKNAFEESRKTIARFIGAKPDEIIFTRNTTEGINMVAHSLPLSSGDVVLGTDKEHNSNLVPWQMLSENGVKHSVVMSKPDSTFDSGGYKNSLNRDVKLVSMIHSSNIDGVTNPAREIIKAAHDNGSLVLLDGAQSVPHKKIDVHKLGVDFLAFSGHKMMGPTGTGILYASKNAVGKLKPFMTGGETVENTTYETHKFLKPPHMFEAGLQDYAGFIGLAAAAKYLESMGMEDAERHEIKLNTKIDSGLRSIGADIIGPEDASLRGGVTSFNLKGIDYRQVSLLLDKMGSVMVRSGQHCVHSWFNARGIKGSARSSLYAYNNERDVDIFLETAKKISRLSR
jgi:cysteine desulfurase/selenocysteine lyase